MKTRFIHMRTPQTLFVNPVIVRANQPDVKDETRVVKKYDHSRKGSHGGATVAFKEVEPNVFSVGFAFCSPNDMFSRASGRTLSKRHLGTVPDVGLSSMPALLAAVHEEMLRLCHVPKTQRKIPDYSYILEK